MHTRRYLRCTPLLGLFALVACEEGGTGPALRDLSLDEQAELSVLEDQGSYDVAVEVAGVANEVAGVHGHTSVDEARAFNDEARATFAQARSAWLSGDHTEALRLSRLARRLVARSLVATGGVPAVEDLIERLEGALLTTDEELVDDVEELREELEQIIAEAISLLESGDSVGAAARAILGEQRLRHRRGRHDRPFRIGQDRARLEVALAGASLELAKRLIDSDPAGDPELHDRRNRWLDHAERMLSMAERALDQGFFGRAVHFARHAQWSALKAVILPGGITVEEARRMIEVAETLLGEAEASLGDAPTELERRILDRAADLLAIGVRRLDAGRRRGVAALWRSATLSSWLIG